MKKLFLSLAVCSMLFMNGCANNTPVAPEKTNDLIIVLNNSSNRPLADLSLIYDEVEEACATGSNISIIVDDGTPFVAESIKIPAIDVSKSSANQKRDIQKYTFQVLEVCQNAVSKTAEIDTYSALSLAERSINPENETKIVMLDSLLPTTGKIDFSEKPLYLTDIDETMEHFSSLDSFKNLSCTKLNIYGVGEVAGEQPNLSSDDYNKLLSFWSEFFEKTGCSNVNISRKPYTVRKNAPDNLPEVSVCIVSQDTNKIAVSNSEENKMPETIQDNTIIEFDSEMIAFSPDTAEIINKEEAMKKLGTIAEQIKNTTDQPVVLAGMTATYGDAASSRALSLNRAEAVKSLFVDELGVPSDKIICIGTGYNNNKLHINDLNADGSLNEKNARQNRKVVAMTESTARESGII